MPEKGSQLSAKDRQPKAHPKIRQFTNSEEQYLNELPTKRLNNTVEIYFRDLGLNWEQLQNKELLDVGAGEANFARAMRPRGILVTSVDIEPNGMGNRGKAPTDIPYIVADFRTGLTLPTESFDLIVGRASIHGMVEVQEDMEAVIREAKRLLKPGGEFRFGPGSPTIRPVRRDEWRKWFDLLERVREGKKITPEEDAWAEKVLPRYELESTRGEELEALTHEERILKMDEYGADDLHKIDPTITAHPIKDRMGKGKDSVYYVMKKEASSSQSIFPG